MTADRTPVERAINRRRLELDMKWQDLRAAAGGMAAETLRRIRLNGTDGVDPRSVARLERALGWQYGSIASLEQGGQPAVLEEDTETWVERQAAAATEAARRQVGLGEDALYNIRRYLSDAGEVVWQQILEDVEAEAEDLTDEEARALTERALENARNQVAIHLRIERERIEQERRKAQSQPKK